MSIARIDPQNRQIGLASATCGRYPQRLAGDAILVSARLTALADVFDALISKRVFTPAFPYEQVVAMIMERRGTHFDPDVADVVLDIGEGFLAIAIGYRDEPVAHRVDFTTTVS